MLSLENKHLLVLQCRGLGDAIISLSLINSLGSSFPDLRIDILTKPQSSAVYKNNPYVGKIHTANFPTTRQFGWSDAAELTVRLGKLRREKYDVCLNTFGDFRENLLGWLVNPVQNRAVMWAKGHPFNRLIRKGLECLVDCQDEIATSMLNVYSVHAHLAKNLGCTSIQGPRLNIDMHCLEEARATYRGRDVVALHPLAGQPSKLWDWEHWRELASAVARMGYDVWIFCSPHEISQLEGWFANVVNGDSILIRAGTLEDFFARLSLVKLLIGLDSFSVHAAHALGIPSIMLSGASDHRIWAPPSTAVVSGIHDCPFYPCYNRPSCLSTADQYICMKAIAPVALLSVARQLLESHVRVGLSGRFPRIRTAKT
jgi:lipopolysaccharide heptosyltransferase III